MGRENGLSGQSPTGGVRHPRWSSAEGGGEGVQRSEVVRLHQRFELVEVSREARSQRTLARRFGHGCSFRNDLPAVVGGRLREPGPEVEVSLPQMHSAEVDRKHLASGGHSSTEIVGFH